MTDVLHDLSTAVFSKTVVGQQEIQTRSLNLAPMVRRLLVLVDGRRNAKDLATFVTGNDIKALLSQLLEQGGQNTRLSLLEALLACKTTEDLRRVYPSWVDTLSASRIGVKRLPELRDKLFVVL